MRLSFYPIDLIVMIVPHRYNSMFCEFPLLLKIECIIMHVYPAVLV